MTTVYLKDHIDAVKKECLRRNEQDHYISPDLVDLAIQAHVKWNLRYNKASGKTYSNQFGPGPCSEYVNDSDVPKYDDDSQAAIWEFSGIVRNSMSRLSRGYPA